MSKSKNWLRNLFNPTGEAKSSAPEESNEAGAPPSVEEKTLSLGNFFDIKEVQDVISECLVKELAMYRGGSGYPDITVWVDDPIAVQLTVPLFQEKLKKDLLHSGCRPLSQRTAVTVRGGRPEDDGTLVTLSKKGKLNPGKVFLSFQNEKVTGDRAQVSICKGKGSLAVDPFVMDSSQKSRFRLGRGETSTRADYSYRINDIVIRTDDPDLAVQDLNNHVSSAHADFVCRDGRFYLQVLPSGSPSGNNSTRIVRDQSPIALDHTGIDYPLSDGDLIELGGSVLLEFRLVK